MSDSSDSEYDPADPAYIVRAQLKADIKAAKALSLSTFEQENRKRKAQTLGQASSPIPSTSAGLSTNTPGPSRLSSTVLSPSPSSNGQDKNQLINKIYGNYKNRTNESDAKTKSEHHIVYDLDDSGDEFMESPKPVSPQNEVGTKMEETSLDFLKNGYTSWDELPDIPESPGSLLQDVPEDENGDEGKTESLGSYEDECYQDENFNGQSIRKRQKFEEDDFDLLPMESIKDTNFDLEECNVQGEVQNADFGFWMPPTPKPETPEERHKRRMQEFDLEYKRMVEGPLKIGAQGALRHLTSNGEEETGQQGTSNTDPLSTEEEHRLQLAIQLSLVDRGATPSEQPPSKRLRPSRFSSASPLEAPRYKHLRFKYQGIGGISSSFPSESALKDMMMGETMPSSLSNILDAVNARVPFDPSSETEKWVVKHEARLKGFVEYDMSDLPLEEAVRARLIRSWSATTVRNAQESEGMTNDQIIQLLVENPEAPSDVERSADASDRLQDEEEEQEKENIDENWSLQLYLDEVDWRLEHYLSDSDSEELYVIHDSRQLGH